MLIYPAINEEYLSHYLLQIDLGIVDELVPDGLDFLKLLGGVLSDYFVGVLLHLVELVLYLLPNNLITLLRLEQLIVVFYLRSELVEFVIKL